MSQSGRKVRRSLGEVPEEILKEKSEKEKAGITRTYNAKTRMEDKDLPGVATLAQQRYVAPEKPSVPAVKRTKPSAASLAVRATAGTLRQTSSQDPSQPALKARVPKSLKHLAKDDNFGVASKTNKNNNKNNSEKNTSKARSFNASAPPSLAALPTDTMTASTTPLTKESQISPDTVERIGDLFSPLANVRTTYQNEEIEKKTHIGTREKQTLAPPPPSSQKVFYNLEDFASACDDPHTPQEWIALGGTEGTPARSRCHNSVREVVWAPCRVIRYDEVQEKYEVLWADGKTKWARRFNIIFDEEDEEHWKERARQADRYRFEYESLQREKCYLESIPNDVVTPVDQDQMDRIIELVAKKFDVNSLHAVEQYTEQAEQFYFTAAKKAVHYYLLRGVEEQERLGNHNLPSLPPALVPSLRNLKGTIFTPSPNFNQARAYLAENLFQAHTALQDTIRAIHNLWFDYSTRELCVSAFQEIPLQLSYFTDAQSQLGAATSEKLRGEWTSTVHSTIQNNLDSHFNFYEDDLNRYEASRMRRFIALVNVMMNSQLRSLVVRSMGNYQKFIEQFAVLPFEDDEEMEELPQDQEEKEHWKAREEGLAAQREKEFEAKQEEDKKFVSKRKSVAAAEEAAAAKALEEEAVPFVWRLGVHENTVPYTRRVLEQTLKPNGLQPLFALKLIEKNRQVCFSPSLEQITLQVMESFNQCVALSSEVHGMGDQLFPLLEMQPTFLKPVDPEEPAVQESRQRVRQILKDNSEAPEQLLQMYKTFEYILEADPEDIADSAMEENLSLTEFDLVFERISRDIDRITFRTPDCVNFELYSIDCKEIKAALTRKANLILSTLMETLAASLQLENTQVIERYQAIHAQLSIDPTTPEELQAQRTYLDQIPEKEADIQKTFAHVTEGNNLLLRYRYLVSDEDFVQYWVGYEWPKTLQQFMEDRNFRFKEYRGIFMQNLRDNCEQLSYDIIQLSATVEDFTHLGDDARADEFYEKAKNISKSIKTYQEQVALYNSHEELFGLATSQYPQLKELKTRFEPYYALWEILSTFNAETERWVNTRLSALQPAEVDQKVTDWGKRVALISKSVKETEPSEVLKRLRESIEKFKPNIPLLYALRSNLQASHWRAIYQQCGIPKDKQGFGAGGVDNNDQRAFSEFLKLGMLNFLPQVEAIATVAQKTYELETELMTMESDWKKLLFEMEPYQDTYKLKSNDTMQLTLDEHILKTQSMMGKPIVRQAPGLQARVTAWEKQLNNIQATLDEWFRCQNTWAYLEPIFSSADISRSLPKEKQLFMEIDDNWHDIMDHTRSTPQILTRCQDETLSKTLMEANTTLDVILKKLQQFLETKRMAFPRFYFISNEELLQILSDSKDPFLVQPYLCKCFEGIKRIQFADHHDIIAMESAEGERVPLTKKVNPGDHNNQVELWLQAVENVMKDSVRDQLQQAIGDYAGSKRTDFIRTWPGQVVIAICSYFWTMEATQAIQDEGIVGLSSYHEKCVQQLDDLILLVRDKNLATVQRCTLEALVVIEVHSKDIIGSLCEKGVESTTSFDWLAQLRYYWDDNHLNVCQVNASLRYGYEYLGNTGRLVITPLTDRCYRTLIGALHLNYGGAPEGPAGTGKTETTKDLAKALGKYCVVYNCSDQISAKDMAKLFKGLTQAGAWGCFDEFNRIEIQVLSVIAQQVATIQDAIVEHRTEFIFEGAQIRLDSGCAIFITMNPGYAGRAELPDNLKALFRPVAMMVPNYAMIGEIQLYSFGFLHGKILSEKIVATYRLCSEQLSSQDHYDYGMRAVKAVLTAAGRLKRAYPDEDEMVLMLRSIKDVNLPKFLSQDVELFKGIVSDLFPGVELPPPDYDNMHAALVKVCAKKNIQLTSYFEEKIQQTYEMICVRHGMMIVGFSFGGKTKILQCLSSALGEMESAQKGEFRTRLVTINPKSVTMAQLYGNVEQSGEWTDGILSNRFRQLAQDVSTDRKWLVLDGPVDAVWIENMNTVLDDNKKLCLQNGDIIPMSKTMNLVFEVQDLACASPATVSRCGMVYVEPTALGWGCLMESYKNSLPESITEVEGLSESFSTLSDLLMETMLEFVRKNTKTIIPQLASSNVSSFIHMFSTFVKEFKEDEALEKADSPASHARLMKMRVEGWFLFSLVWSVGGCLDNKARAAFNEALQNRLTETTETYRFTITLPEKGQSFYDLQLQDNLTEVRFVDWLEYVPELNIPEGSEYQDIIVPTRETTKYSFLLKHMINGGHPALLVGDTGTGKTILIKALLKSLPSENFSLNMIQFSAQTTAAHLQKLVDGSLERRRKGYYGPPINKKMIIFIDDTNLPQLEEYGAQPPIELLRQHLDHGGWYNHSKDGIEFHNLVDLLFLCAMGPAGGGRNPITQRFSRHFNAFSVPSFDQSTLSSIFSRLCEWILSKGFSSGLRAQCTALVGATVELYETLVDNLKPSPEKSHYTFNMRDVSKVFQGINMVYPPSMKDEMGLAELWLHEVSRAFADRFINAEDTQWFRNEANKLSKKHFKISFPDTDKPLIFSSMTDEENNYIKVEDLAIARQELERKLEIYNLDTRDGELNLVIFNYVLEHVARVSRVLKQPGGNLLLVGVGGSGRRSCTRLAAYLMECDYTSLTITKDYGHSDFLDDVRQLLLKTGQKGYSTAFVLSDTQITSETFLEDICSLLNTGEIPGLWDTKQDKEAYENAVASLREVGKSLGRPDTAEALQTLFVERCKKHMHIVLCFSPLGSTLRERLRKFPSLVNCTTIDWFTEWPEEGLRGVAQRFLLNVELTDQERDSIREMFVAFQQQVRELGVTYLEEAHQHTYVTPTSYLDLLSTFARLLKEKREEINGLQFRYANGLAQLKRTEDQVEVMKQELALMRPELAKKQEETNKLIKQVEAESKVAEEQKAIVAVDEAAANEQAAAAKKMKDASQEKVDEAQPLVEEAQRAVQDLDPKALQEVKALKTPPQGVKYVIEVLCTLLGGNYKPKPIRDPLTGKTTVPYWEHAKTALLTGDFKNILLNAYPDIVDNAPDSQIEKVKKKMQDDMFKMENIRKTSVALIGVATYIKAVVEYYKQNKIIKPLLAQSAAAQAEFDEAMTGLNKKKEELRVISEKLQALTDQLDKVNKDKQELEDRVNDTDTKLTRAKKLIEGLGGEKTRFAKEAERYKEELKYVVGNVVLSSGVVAYMGPFLHKYRQQAVTGWRAMLKEQNILVSEDYSLEKFGGNPIDIQEWKLQQLPTDGFSVDNAVIMKNSSRWPLLVDPQQQANKWIRNRERDRGLVVVRPSEGDYLRHIRDAIASGKPVLLENVEETIDPMLENLLLKKVVKEGNMMVMQLGEPVEWNDEFRLYITTKLPRPHYLPEVSTKVTLINFMITEQGLQDQLLQRVMLSERKEVEEKKQALTLEAAANQAGLKSTEDRILAILSSDGNILESEEAINELDSSKEQSDRIAKRQEEIEAMERISNRTRDMFVPVAHLGSILFFCVTELSNIDPMYQNSLQAYASIFQEALAKSEKTSEVEDRINNINTTFKKSLYERICRSLFAKDELLFSFIMSLKIYTVDPVVLRWLLMGGFEGEMSSEENPFSWLPELNWRMLVKASTQLPSPMCDLVELVKANEPFFRDYYESSNPLVLELPASLKEFTPLERLLLVRCFRTDKIVPAVTNYVQQTLGDFFVSAPLYSLDKVVDELSDDPSVPIILVLSPGADPNAELDRLAEQYGMSNSRLFKLSLGQGQDVPAKELIESGKTSGHWVLLQNCHLYADFMPTLSRIIEDYSDITMRDKLHRDYRLWLTSLPSEIFPIAILQNGVKLVQEPPKGLKSNLLQSLLSDPIADPAFFDSSNKPEIWHKMLFGLCFFHAVVQERRHFGPLGWNRPYEFNDTDRRISVRQLLMFLNENDLVPYDALLYLVGQCNYGGRVTDDWDRRCLMATLEVYFTPLILEDDYAFSEDAAEYYAPPFGEYSTYVDYVNALPLQQPPTIFGLHENADITKDERDARILLSATLLTQPRESSPGESSSVKLDPRAVVKQLAGEVLGRLPQLFDIEEIQRVYPIDYSQSMNTVLLQEAIRYNRLLAVARRSLQEVQDAVDGKVVMSVELEQVFNAIFDGRVPDMWKRLSYPSLKPFGAYVSDLIARLHFLRKWCREGPPPSFWLSGFFFTQSFLTGVMQNYARRHKVEIDKLVWEFTVMSESNFTTAPKDGCYIYGLYLEGAGWNGEVLCESKPKELFIEFPTMKLVPAQPEDVPEAPTYKCPCYKTTDRKGVLSTTGHSTNFILTMNLPRDADVTENHWVLRGVALFTQLDY